MKTSDHLTVGGVYTRKELMAKFGISDATINTGIFQPRGHDSVWLFVTEKKTPDRTQYEDMLDGDVLDWDSQPAGRKDYLIIEHKQRGLELLLFYREKKYEFPRAGFRFEGAFDYDSHAGEGPAHFKLHRAYSQAMKFWSDFWASFENWKSENNPAWTREFSFWRGNATTSIEIEKAQIKLALLTARQEPHVSVNFWLKHGENTSLAKKVLDARPLLEKKLGIVLSDDLTPSTGPRDNWWFGCVYKFDINRPDDWLQAFEFIRRYVELFADLFPRLDEILALEEQLSSDTYERLFAGTLVDDHVTQPEEYHWQARRVRKGQGVFRDQLIAAYDGQCAITGWAPTSVLDAAHIVPYADEVINDVDNGLLLRTDLHNLFDDHLLQINPIDFTLELSETLRETPYWALNGRTLRRRSCGRPFPKVEYLKRRYHPTKCDDT